MDGLIARGDYEHEFTLHQFTILPGGAAQKFKITQFDKIKMADDYPAAWRIPNTLNVLNGLDL